MKLDIKLAYWRFYRAARKRNLDRMLALIREVPELATYIGQAGTLIEVIDQEMPEHLEVMFQTGLRPDVESEPLSESMLQHAAAQGNIPRLRLLVAYGADTMKRNSSGEVALGYACSWGKLDAVKLLVEAGSNVNTIEEDPESGYRNTPLDCAREFPEITEYLRGKGAKYLQELETS